MSGSWTAIIRCDGGTRDGMGHVMRCLTLAGAFRDGPEIEPRFVTFSPDRSVHRVIERAGFVATSAGGPAGSKDDLSALSDELAVAGGRTIVVVDNRYVSRDYVADCRERAFTVCIDDEETRDLPCDILINNHVRTLATDYAQRMDRDLLIGPAYNLINPEFFDLSRRAVQGEARSRILVNMGGADPENCTEWVLTHLDKVLADYPVVIVVGAAHTDPASVREAARRRLPEAEVVVNTPAMAEIASTCGLAITAAGTTAYELSVLGLAQLAIPLDAGQRILADAMQGVGCMEVISDIEDLDPIRAVDALRNLLADDVRRKRMAMCGRRLFAAPGAPEIATKVARMAAHAIDGRPVA